MRCVYSYQREVVDVLMRPKGLRVLKDYCHLGVRPETALVMLTIEATGITNPERAEEIARPLFSVPMLRGRIRRAGFDLARRTK